MGMTLWVFADGGSLLAFEHALQRRCLRVYNRVIWFRSSVVMRTIR